MPRHRSMDGRARVVRIVRIGLVVRRVWRLVLQALLRGVSVAFRLAQWTLSAGGASAGAELATVHLISENYFKVLGVSPIEGRTFDSMSARDPTTDPSVLGVLISENYWRRRFDAVKSYLRLIQGVIKSG